MSRQYTVQAHGCGVNSIADLHKHSHLYDFCLFADTGDEKRATYAYMDKFVKPFCEKKGIKFVVIKREESLTNYIKRTGRFPGPMPGSRWCTQDWKIRPMRRFYRKELGATRNNPIREAILFAYDEMYRADRQVFPKYIDQHYPLVDAGITRDACEAIIRQANWPIPPKSSCVNCFFQRKEQVRATARSDPEAFARLVEIEESSPRYEAGYKLFGRKWSVRDIIKQKNLADFGFVKEEPEPDWVTGHCMDGRCDT